MIFPVSARLQLAGRSDESGIPELKSYLVRYLSDERGRVLLDNASSDGQRLCAYLRQNLGIKARSLTLTLEELETRIARVQKELSGKQQTMRQLQARIVAESDAIKARIRLDLEEFVAAFGAALPSGDRSRQLRRCAQVSAAVLARHVQAVGRAGRRPRRRASWSGWPSRSSRSPTRTCSRRWRRWRQSWVRRTPGSICRSIPSSTTSGSLHSGRWAPGSSCS
jgi:hypothetical protein